MPKKVTKKQWRYLNSSGSPLSEDEKDRMRSERRHGKIRFGKKRKSR